MSVINKIKIGTGAEVDIGVTWSNVSGKPNYAGSSSAGGPANSANTLLTKSSSAEAELFVTFVDSNNSTAANESVYTDGDLKYNPSTNTLTAGTFKGSLSGNATSATTASQAVSATKATKDGSDNIITDTYATKTELTTALGDVETLLSKI